LTTIVFSACWTKTTVRTYRMRWLLKAL